MRKAIITTSIIQTMNAGEGVEKREPSWTVGGNVYWYSHYGDQYGSVGGVCNFLGSVLPQQILKRHMNQCCSLVTVQFYLVSKGKYILKAWGRADPRDMKRSKRPNFGSSFYVFLLPLSLPYVKRASKEGCLLYLRFSLRSLDLPLFYFHRLCPSLSFSHHHSRLLFPVLTT